MTPPTTNCRPETIKALADYGRGDKRAIESIRRFLGR